MKTLKLFESSEHLERCYDDPDPYQVESIYYTPWTILYAGSLALELSDSEIVSHDLATVLVVDIHTPSLAQEPDSVSSKQFRAGVEW